MLNFQLNILCASVQHVQGVGLIFLWSRLLDLITSREQRRSQCIRLINPGLGRSKFSLITSLDGPDLKGGN